MSRITDLLFARRDASPSPVRMIGFPSDGGLVTAGVTATTVLGLSAVTRCLDILTNGVSQLDWEERRSNLELPPSRLVTQPHPAMTRREWTSFVVACIALFDRSYLLKTGGEDSEGVPMNLLPLDPDAVMPATVSPLQYVSSLLPSDEYWINQTKVTRDDLVIIRRGPLPGISETASGIIRLARITFAAAIAAEGYSSRYWQSGGSPTVALETDAILPAGMAGTLQGRWAESRAKGPDNAAVLEGGVRAKPFGADPTTESAVEARRELVADIARYFGVPTRIVNAPTGDSETYTNSESANLDLLRFTLQNYIGGIEDAISDLLPGGRRMKMRTGPIVWGPFAARAQAYQLATNGKAWMLPQEARDELGLPPVENPDELNPPAPVVAPVVGGEGNGG